MPNRKWLLLITGDDLVSTGLWILVPTEEVPNFVLKNNVFTEKEKYKTIPHMHVL